MNRNDHRAFEILVRQHHRRLLGYALSLVSDQATAEDIVQEALVTAYAKLETFDPDGNFGAWMRTIIRFKYLEWCRRQRETVMAPETLEALDQRHEEWEQGEQDKNQVLDSLRACMERLPETMSRAVEQFYFQEWSGRRIAEGSGDNENTIRQRLTRARVLLADCVQSRLQKHEGIV